MGQESPSSFLSLSSLSLEAMENQVEASHLVMACRIVDTHKKIKSHSLIDTEGT